MTTITRDIESPPGGWRYTVPETGLLLKGGYYHVLKKKVLDHMRANSIPVPEDFDEFLADAACAQSGLGAPFCGGATPKPVAGGLPFLNMATASRFLSTMMAVVKDRKFVSREEAERRAAICLACPLATSMGHCKGCSQIFSKMERLLKKNPIEIPPEKEFCSACGCKISLKCLIDNKTLDRAESERPLYHSSCWRNSSSNE